MTLPPRRPWAAFAARHLHDYNAAATRRWLLILCGGAISLGLACTNLLLNGGVSVGGWWTVGLSLAIVAVVAAFPVHIPRTKYSLSASDVFIFTLLALHGPALAVPAAAVEGVIGAWLSSKRLTSRLSTPSAAAAAIGVMGMAYGVVQHALLSAGLDASMSLLIALLAIALPYFAGTTLPLIGIVCAKNGQPVSLRDWAENYGWLAAIVLISAAVAGVVALNVRQLGPILALAAAMLALALLGLVNLSLRAHARQLARQDARIGKAQREVELSQRRFSASFTHAAIGMAIVSPDGSIQQVNAALCRLLGRNESDLVAAPFDTLLPPGELELLARHTAGNSEEGPLELRCTHPSGARIWVALHCSRFLDPDESDETMIFQLHDVTERRMAESELHHIAYHDSLTDLSNRNGFNERLRGVIERCGQPGSSFAVMFLDLDRFKVVNDSLGHAAGNELLRQVAQRLQAQMGPGDLVARLGGDEFAMLLEGVAQHEFALKRGEQILHALQQPIRIMGTELQAGASIGVTFSDLGPRTADEVLRDADLAMYAAKAQGRGRVAVFDTSMHARVAERMLLEAELRRTLANDGLSLAFQPLYDLSPYRINGFEALARWVHPERGFIGPGVFIPLAEECGLISELTRWMIERSVRELARWHAELPHLRHLGVHVNVSGRDMADPALVPYVRQVLQRHGLAPERLTLEITESVLMESLTAALATLNALRDLGVRFSIDDFGTGYSSLSYLSTLKFDSLKIDRSFVTGLAEDPQALEIVRAVLNLGRSLGKKVIAEGIETPAQLAALKQLGVPVGQGYLMSRPLPAAKIDALLRAPVVEPAAELAVA